MTAQFEFEFEVSVVVAVLVVVLPRIWIILRKSEAVVMVSGKCIYKINQDFFSYFLPIFLFLYFFLNSIFRRFSKCLLVFFVDILKLIKWQSGKPAQTVRQSLKSYSFVFSAIFSISMMLCLRI